MSVQYNHGKLFYDTGELHYEGGLKNGMPFGEGIKYYKNGMKYMVGLFEDWFISSGREYYENGNLKFEGKYNLGPRNYYGPRFFLEGKLFLETGQLWYEGTFKIEKHGSMGYPVFKGAASFLRGTEYDEQGIIVKVY